MANRRHQPIPSLSDHGQLGSAGFGVCVRYEIKSERSERSFPPEPLTLASNRQGSAGLGVCVMYEINSERSERSGFSVSDLLTLPERPIQQLTGVISERIEGNALEPVVEYITAMRCLPVSHLFSVF